MWCRNVLQLPLDVLVIILAFLHGDHLRTARTVCKDFRKASNLCVTRLSFCGPNTSWRMIKERLQVFTKVTCLDLAIRKAPQASLLQRPEVLSRLRKVRLTCRGPDAIIALLAAAPRLTKLEVVVESAGRFRDSQFRAQLARALRNCRHPVEVTLCLSDRCRVDYDWDYNYRNFAWIDSTPILRLTAHLVSLSQLPARQVTLTHFSRLECLELIHAETGNQVEAVAALTRLTRLALRVEESMGLPQLLPLSQLTALQELKVQACNFQRYSIRDFRQVVGPMVRLRELRLEVWCWHIRWPLDLGDVDFLLAALPAVTCLEFDTNTGMLQRPPGAFLSNGFAGLRKLSLSPTGSPEEVAQLATQLVLPELEALSFEGDCQSLLSNLRPIPRLTELKAQFRNYSNSLPYLSGTVLARFKGLQQLHLAFVLDLKQWDENVKSLAMLTDLRVLSIEHHHRWHVTSEVLMPLTALKQLQKLELHPVWASNADVAKFWEAMKAVRHEMGFSGSVVPSLNCNPRITFVF
jgi:hypothetical protein